MTDIATRHDPLPERRRRNWRNQVIYEIYPKSFADGNGDGVGDLSGIRARLPYLVELGVDALWIAPWYPSPGVDGGYDVEDYCSIHPDLGSLADAEALIEEAHSAGLQVVIDLVVNHTSNRHPWFREALADRPGSAARRRYIFRDGRGENGELPPNNWFSAFADCAWTRVAESDGHAGQWYLHTFAAEQPDLDWTNPEVRDEVARILRFWFDRGVDGIRADAVPAMAKVAGLPDTPYDTSRGFESSVWTDAPNWDVDGVHEVMRGWRTIADSYDPPRYFIAEAVVSSPTRLARYLRKDELDAAFNFDFLRAGWDAGRLRAAIETTLTSLAPVDAPATWVLSSHDETRHVTRFGRRDTRAAVMGFDEDPAVDEEAGRRRARAAVLLELALPGIACLYQGEELGLPEVTDLPEEVLQDPIWERSGHTSRGRDGCRVPIPWSGQEPPYGFSSGAQPTWLPQPGDWQRLTVAAESADPSSMLNLYRTALSLRRHVPDLATDDFEWIDAPTDVLRFRRGEAFECVVNLGTEQVGLDDPALRTILTSDRSAGRQVAPDTAAWLIRTTSEGTRRDAALA